VRRALTPILFLALAGCSRETSAPTAASSPGASASAAARDPVGVYEAKDGGQVVSVGGYSIETAADLPERKNSTTSVTGDNQTVVVLRGWSIVVRDGKVTVGGREYGAVAAGGKIRLAADGVRVDGELRGPLP
jgi:hypothetical protein